MGSCCCQVAPHGDPHFALNDFKGAYDGALEVFILVYSHYSHYSHYSCTQLQGRAV
jgi:hypothetical protein